MTTDGPSGGDPRFHTTRWSLVVDAAEDASAGDASSGALESLCDAYWYPLYAFARRSGSATAEAQDLVQDFFATLIERGYLAGADPARGRFRTFLLTSFENHRSKLRARANAEKRGGGRQRVPFDVREGERRYRREPTDPRTPQAIYERRWALTLLERAFARLEARHRDQGPERARRFAALRPLIDGGPAQPYAEIGDALGLSETAVKVAVHRLRREYRGCLRAEIADTVRDPSEIDDEIARLVRTLRGGNG